MEKTFQFEPIDLTKEPGKIPFLTHRGTLYCDDTVVNVVKLSDGTVYVPVEQFESSLSLFGEQPASAEERERARKANIQQRFDKFRKRALEIHRAEKVLSTEQATRWFEYWTERGEDDYKHRWEKEKSFDILKRMITWRDRNVSAPPATNQPHRY